MTDSICRINREACAWEFDARKWSRVEGSCSLPVGCQAPWMWEAAPAVRELESEPALEVHLSELGGFGLYLTLLLVVCRLPNFQIGPTEG